MAFLSPEETGATQRPGAYNNQHISLDNFLVELRQPREAFGPDKQQPLLGSQPPNTDHPESDATFYAPSLPGSDPSGQPLSDEASLRKARYTAKFVVGSIDTGVANGCKIIAKAKAAKPYQATPEEKSDLVEVWAEYLKQVGGDIPPGILVLLTTSVVYTPKLIQAFSDRKLLQQVQDQAGEIKALQDELMKLKKPPVTYEPRPTN